MAKEKAPKRSITISRESISHAKPNNSRMCALALALAEIGAVRPFVRLGMPGQNNLVAFTINDVRYRYTNLAGVEEFIQAFDTLGPDGVHPTTVSLLSGTAEPAIRTGGHDLTQRYRHAKGGRAARPGYTGPRPRITSLRINGFAVHKNQKKRRTR